MVLNIRNQTFQPATAFEVIQGKLGIAPIINEVTNRTSALFSKREYFNDYGETTSCILVYSEPAVSTFFHANNSSQVIHQFSEAFAFVCFHQEYRPEHLFVDCIEDIFPKYKEFCEKGLNRILIEAKPKVASEVELNPFFFSSHDLAEIGSYLRNKYRIRYHGDHWVPFFANQYAKNLLA